MEVLDEKDHPFSEVVIMVPPVAGSHDDYDEMSNVPIRTQHRGAPDFMDLCEADIRTDWFMLTNSYHHVARHVDLMFTPGTFKPVIPFTPATYAFCFKYPYCKETVNLAQVSTFLLSHFVLEVPHAAFLTNNNEHSVSIQVKIKAYKTWI